MTDAYIPEDCMKTIKIWDGVNVITEDGTTRVDGPLDLWKLFGWDIENDPNAKECATIITRELFCFGRIDLSAMNNGKTLILRVIPASNEKEEE